MSGWLLTPAESQAVRLSLLVAVSAVAASLPFGIGLGWLLARRRFPGKVLLETLLHLPLVLPPVVTGYLLLVVFGRRGWVGPHLERWLGIRLVFDWKGAALAAAVMAFPLMVRAIRLAFSAVDPRLVGAARSLGAGPAGAFLSVSLPLASPGIVAGSVLAFARSMGEFGATIMIAGSIPGETRTIPLEIYGLLDTPGGLEGAWRLVAVSIVISAGALLLGELLEKRGRSRLEEPERAW
jgi:molybdate transport system permease protein